jgi:Ser/Thr protein kinase RdoA (MazF antagonist)
VDALFAVAERFTSGLRIVDVRSLGNGNINDTFLVTVDTQRNTEAEKHFVLQRLNTNVFRRPDLVMRNMRTSTEHIKHRLRHLSFNTGRSWEVPVVLTAQDGQDHWLDADGAFWRAVSFIEGAKSFDTIMDVGHAGEVGYALGMFHLLLSDLPPYRLADTLEGFHITPRYLLRYAEVLANCSAVESPELHYCLRFVSERSGWAHVLENAREGGKLLLRTIHGDPKVNNILMDPATMQAVGIVDLDTVKPGLVHYDIGDCLRSGCNPMGEETAEWESVYFETGLCRAILRGYLATAREFLTETDLDYLYDSIRLIAFELGLRFFTDHLEGDVYFRAKQPGHNLARALVQFRLTESIEAQETAIRNIIREIR